MALTLVILESQQRQHESGLARGYQVGAGVAFCLGPIGARATDLHERHPPEIVAHRIPDQSPGGVHLKMLLVVPDHPVRYALTDGVVDLAGVHNARR